MVMVVRDEGELFLLKVYVVGVDIRKDMRNVVWCVGLRCGCV